MDNLRSKSLDNYLRKKDTDDEVRKRASNIPRGKIPSDRNPVELELVDEWALRIARDKIPSVVSLLR